MARTKRSAATMAAADENAEPQAPAASATSGQSSRTDDLANPSPSKAPKTTARAGGRRSKPSKPAELAFVPDAIDDPVPTPTSGSLVIHSAQHVLKPDQIVFPDIDAGEADRRYWIKFHEPDHLLQLKLFGDLCGSWRCEYPERAGEVLTQLYIDWPGVNEAGTPLVRREKHSEREWMHRLDELRLAVESGAIPPSNASDALLFEPVVDSPATFPLPPTLASSFNDNGEYTGFERAVVAELSHVLIQPVMHVRRAIIIDHFFLGNTYVYDDPETRTKPKYEWVTYTHPDLLQTSAEFNALTPAAFTAQLHADPYHAQSKSAKPKVRGGRANHPYPLPHKDHAIEARVAWVAPALPVGSEEAPAGDNSVTFVLDDKGGVNDALAKHIRPEMLPYLRVAIRPVHGQIYDPSSGPRSIKYRWSVYLRTNKVNEVLRSPRAENAEQVGVIRDLLHVVGCQAGWIATGYEDEETAGPLQGKGLLDSVCFPQPESISHLQPSDHIPDAAKLDAICSLVFRSRRTQTVLAWLLDRERPENQVFESIPPHSIRVKQPLVRLGPAGAFYYEPFSGQFLDSEPTHVVINPQPPTLIVHPPLICSDSLLDLGGSSHLDKRQYVCALVALAPKALPEPPHSHASPPADYIPTRATIIVCPVKEVDHWLAYSPDPAIGQLSMVCIRNWDEYVSLTMDRLHTCDVVVVAVDFLLGEYQRMLSIAALGPFYDEHASDKYQVSWNWADWKTRRYCRFDLRANPDDDYESDDDTAAFCGRLGPPISYSMETGAVNMSSQGAFEDAFATFGPPAHWDRSLLTGRAKVARHLQSCPILLHKLYWRRIVFDQVTRVTNKVDKCECRHGEPPSYDSDVPKLPTPLREFLAASAVTFSKSGRMLGHSAQDTMDKLAICPGDEPPGNLSRRSQKELVEKISLAV